MAERGALPAVPARRRVMLRAARAFFTPLLPDDYLEMINPVWSTRELRGRIVRIELETRDAATVTIKPGWAWPGHRPGQYLRVGIVVDGVHHWRAYLITSDPGRPDGCISITPKLVETSRRRDGCGVAVPRARGEAGRDRPTRRRGRDVHAARPAAGQAAVDQRSHGSRRS